MTTKTHHRHYGLLNLLGYGLSKFGHEFVKNFGHSSKQSFYDSFVDNGIAETSGVIKNRQDLFDPFFDNGRRGWWQKGNTYIHRKKRIDLLFGELDVSEFSNITKLYMNGIIGKHGNISASPVLKSKFKQLQLTGVEAELYFIENYQLIGDFRSGTLDDARLFGDGYDFQVKIPSKYYLAEIKGVREKAGSVRMTEKEYEKAKEYQFDYALVVISNLEESPKITAIFNPAEKINFQRNVTSQVQVSYHSPQSKW